MKTAKLYDKHTIEGTEIMPFNNFQAAITEERQSIINKIKEMKIFSKFVDGEDGVTREIELIRKDDLIQWIEEAQNELGR